jgi:hypothetical protein
MELQYNKSAVNLDKLTVELAAVPGLSGLSFYDGTLVVWYSYDLDAASVNQVDSIVSAHTASDVRQLVGKRIQDATAFGQKILLEFGIDNVLLGVTTDQIRNIATKMNKTFVLLQAGALYSALAEIEATVPDDVLTQARLDAVADKIRVYLGL